jgi:hypothetical protein
MSVLLDVLQQVAIAPLLNPEESALRMSLCIHFQADAAGQLVEASVTTTVITI